MATEAATEQILASVRSASLEAGLGIGKGMAILAYITRHSQELPALAGYIEAIKVEPTCSAKWAGGLRPAGDLLSSDIDELVAILSHPTGLFRGADEEVFAGAQLEAAGGPVIDRLKTVDWAKLLKLVMTLVALFAKPTPEPLPTT